MLIITFFINFSHFCEYYFIIKAQKVYKLLLYIKAIKTQNLCKFEPSIDLKIPKKGDWMEIGYSVREIGFWGF